MKSIIKKVLTALIILLLFIGIGILGTYVYHMVRTDDGRAGTEGGPAGKQAGSDEGTTEDGARSSEEMTTEPEATTEEEEKYLSESEAASFLRNEMKKKQFHISVSCRSSNKDGKKLAGELISDALEHNGVPTEGDYLWWQYSSWNATVETRNEENASASVDAAGNRKKMNPYRYRITFEINYYTGSDQEKEVKEETKRILKALKLDDKTDYEKVKAIYDYICETVEYGDTDFYDGDENLQYTCYAAMILHRSVCQGYALMFYRLALEAGLDARVVSGIGDGESHSWNIVEVDGFYYNLDATWDHRNYILGNEYEYFLRCQENFPDHERDKKFDTEDFHETYPMGFTDYFELELDFEDEEADE